MRARVFPLLVSLAAAVAAGCAQSDADASITTKVRAKLDADRIVTNSSAIQIETSRKVVTLTGPVQTREAQAQAVKLARTTDGVENVVDRLTVAPAGSSNPAPQAEAEAAVTPSSASR